MAEGVSLDDWKGAWSAGRLGFHKVDPHHLLLKHIDKLTGGRSAIKIFFPLCGKSVDMKWLYDEGHTVVGVEVASQALQDFYKEHGLEYEVLDVPGIQASLYRSLDGRLRLYCCDLFAFTPALEGLMDGIWDRGSLVAINKDDRQRYADLMISLLAKDCNYLLETFFYDDSMFAGPPHCISDDLLCQLYGERCSIDKLDSVDGSGDIPPAWGLKEFNEVIHLLKLKS